MTEHEPFATAQDAAAYTLAGRATLTLSSERTGARFTYRVDAKKDADGKLPEYPTLFFVSLLTGPENTSDYRYLGTLQHAARRHDGEAAVHTVNGLGFRLTRKSCAREDAPSVKAFRFFHKNVLVANHLPDGLTVRHEGTCGRCGRPLTVPESIDRGIGPECAKKTNF